MDDLAPIHDELVPEVSAASARKPWGFWATVGFSLVVVAALAAIQVGVVIGFMAIYMLRYPHANVNQLQQDLGTNGLFVSLAAWSSMPVGLGLVLLFARLRRGWTIGEYLALKPVSMRTMLVWLGLTLVFAAASDGLTCVLGRPIVPEFMSKAYQTAGWTPLLWAALLVAAPVCEEALFRGFMIPGILQSRLGAVGAILITAAGWAALHTQYDLYGVMTIFLVGILLGVARLTSQSLYPTLAMHSMMSLIATIEAALSQPR